MAPPLSSLSPDTRCRRHTCCPAIRPPPAKSAAAASLLGFAPFSSTFSPYLRCSLAPPRGPAANPNSARLRLPPHRQQPLLRLLSVDDYGLLLTDLKPQLEPRRGAAATASRVWPWPPSPWRGGRLHPIDLPRLLHGRHAPVVLPERRRARRPPPPEQRLPLLACISCAPPGQAPHRRQGSWRTCRTWRWWTGASDTCSGWTKGLFRWTI